MTSVSEGKRCKLLETTPEIKWIKTWYRSISIKLQQPTNGHNRCACMQNTIFMQLGLRRVANMEITSAKLDKHSR